MHITLRPGEKLYLNGAVLKADRKVCLELMNDATFLLEAHVMHADKAGTPMRQLYFIVQTMLMDPHDTKAAQAVFADMSARMLATYADPTMQGAIVQTGKLVAGARYFDALKGLRAVFERDDALMAGDRAGALALAS